MNKSVTKIHSVPSPFPGGPNRMFRVFFEPDPDRKDWEVGMQFYVNSVNRETGEIQFSLDVVPYSVPKEDA